jgi:hypothetical protein
VVLPFVREGLELADLVEDGGRGGAAGGEIDERIDALRDWARDRAVFAG